MNVSPSLATIFNFVFASRIKTLVCGNACALHVPLDMQTCFFIFRAATLNVTVLLFLHWVFPRVYNMGEYLTRCECIRRKQKMKNSAEAEISRSIVFLFIAII